MATAQKRRKASLGGATQKKGGRSFEGSDRQKSLP
jgi:hypothetical protein